MNPSISIQLDPDLQQRLDLACKALGRTRAEIIIESLRRQLALLLFEQARRHIMPFAEARGYLTDEDISRDVS